MINSIDNYYKWLLKKDNKMKEIYFEIYPGEDGIKITKIHDINKYLEEIIEEDNPEFLIDFPENEGYGTIKANNDIFDTQSYCCDDNFRIIIKGHIVTPKKKEVVTKYTMEDE